MSLVIMREAMLGGLCLNCCVTAELKEPAHSLDQVHGLLGAFGRWLTESARRFASHLKSKSRSTSSEIPHLFRLELFACLPE